MQAERIRIGSLFIACILACAGALFQASAGETLARVQSNGLVRCGLSTQALLHSDDAVPV